MQRLRGILIVMLLGAAACQSRTADLGMSDSAFVQVMGELKVVADAPGITEPVRAQRRDAVLRKRGMSAARLEQLSATLSAHPQHARQLWSAIEVKAVKLSQPAK